MIDAPVAGRQVVYRCEPGDFPRGLWLLATFLETELRKALPDIVVVRSMDWAQTRRENVVRPRLQVEGVVAATARHVVESVVILTGKAMADLIGMAKADADDNADALLPGHQPQVALAALAALTIKSRG